MPAQTAGGKGFLGSLFDLSFESLIGLRVAAFLYVVALVLGGLSILGGTVTGVIALTQLASAGGQSRLLAALPIVAAPIVYAFYVVYLRFCIELVVVLFRIAENTGKTVRQLAVGVPLRPSAEQAPADSGAAATPA
jgi:hypothetical protein